MSNQILPATLCRVIYSKNYFVDQKGTVLAYEVKSDENGEYPLDINGFDQRVLPLVHPDEWEVIARVFAWEKYNEKRENFRLITLDSKLVDLKQIKPHGTLDHGEYLGIVPQKAIVSDLEYTWVKDNKPSKISRSAKANWPRIFALSQGYSPVLLNN